MRAYPAFLEAWRLARAAVAPAALEADVQALSDRFTCARPERFGDYFADARARAAYGLFFFPQSFVRARLPLAELLELRGWQPGEHPRVLDVGAGLGACGVGAAMLLRERGGAHTVRLSALDHSPAALADLRDLCGQNAAHLPGITLERTFARTLPAFLKKPEEAATPYDLIVAGFALNEAWSGLSLPQRKEQLEKLAALLSPNGLLLVLEPALKETALPLQELSDAVSAAGALHRWGPYWGEFPCPLRAGKKYWAHEVRTWTPPGSLQQLNRRLWREIGELKFHWAAWGKPSAPPPPGGPVPLRLCTPFSPLKGRFEWAGVTPQGALVRCDLPMRHLSKEDERACDAIERGDTLFLENAERLEENRWRVNALGDIARRYSPR